jgi:hypothetical protein
MTTQAVRNAKSIQIPGLPSEPMSSEDATIVDEAMAIVMEARRERSERLYGANSELSKTR